MLIHACEIAVRINDHKLVNNKQVAFLQETKFTKIIVFIFKTSGYNVECVGL